MNTQNNSLWPAPFLPISGLYLVATPIGNLRDMTLRAIDILSAADVIYCEDTRVTGKLLKAFGITGKMQVYNDHSDEAIRKRIVDMVRDKKIVALVSDAGMPLISDPGYKLLQDCRAQQVPVWTVPGANAVLAGLQLSALPSDQFFFGGFLPSKSSARLKIFEEAKQYNATLVFYESAKRIENAVEDALTVLGDRPAVIARELTKKFEQTLHGKLSELGQFLPVKGEVVFIIDGVKQADIDMQSIEGELLELMQDHSLKDAVKVMQERVNLPKKELYNMALGLKDA